MQTKNAITAKPSNVSTTRAVRLALISSAIFSVMFALIKLLGRSYPAGEILFCRSFFALIPILPLIIKEGGLSVFKTKRPMMHATRSAMGLTSAFLCIESLKLLPLSEATSIFYSAPLITTLLALPMLQEKIPGKKMLAIIVGFLGVLYMMQPHLSSNITGAVMALGSAIGSSIVSIELRKMGETEKALTIVVYFMLACTIAGIISMPFAFTVPSGSDALILLAIGITGGIAQLFMTEAYQYAPASTVAPMNYSALLWASCLDAMLFGKPPKLTTIIGAAVIAISGIFVARIKGKDKD